MSYDVLIKNGTVVTPETTIMSDVGIRHGKVTAIGEDLGFDAIKVINAYQKLVLPGGLDVHVHFNNRVAGTVTEDFYAGTKAAAAGGVTTIVDFAPQDPKKGLMKGIENRIAEAEGNVCVDYSFHGMITDYTDNIEKELISVFDFGIPTHKMYMTYRYNGWYSDDAQLFRALMAFRPLGGMLMVHAESDSILEYLRAKYHQDYKKWGAYAHVLSRPNYVETEAIQRIITWTKATGGHAYVVHLTTGEGAQMIQDARRAGIRIDTETCPQYLLLTDEVFKDKKRGHLYATCPQVKKQGDCDRLWQAVMQGDINVIATDTCTFNQKQKSRWKGDFTKIPYGMPGVETMIPAMYTYGVMPGKISLNRLVQLVCSGPAKQMGMYPRKGTIAIDSDADLIIIDPKKSKKILPKNLATQCDWSPYEGLTMHGFPETVLSRGQEIVSKGKFTGTRGHGTFIPRRLSE